MLALAAVMAALPLPPSVALAGTWIETHAGAGLPQGGFGNTLDAGWIAGVTAEHTVIPGWTVGLETGWKQFGGSDDATRAERERLSAIAGRPVAAHLGASVVPLLLRVRGEQQGDHLHPFHLAAGAGVYHMRRTVESEIFDRDSTSTRFGLQAAAGFGLPRVGPADFMVEIVYDWMGNATSLIELRTGARFGMPH